MREDRFDRIMRVLMVIFCGSATALAFTVACFIVFAALRELTR